MNRAFIHLAAFVRSRSLFGMLLATGLATGPSACMLSAEADVPDVQVTQHDIAFDGVPNAGLLGDVSTGMSFTQKRPALDLPKEIDSSVKAMKVDLVAKTGIKDFNFLRFLRITMAPTDSTAEPVELINYEKADGAVVGAILTIPAKNPVNILEQWKADSAVFNVQVGGSLPDQAWTIDASVHFAGKVSYKY
jgi:hypothetical protein